MSNKGAHSFTCASFNPVAALLCLFLIPFSTKAGGVTLITHGFSGNVNGWIKRHGRALARSPISPAQIIRRIRITLTTDGTNYFYQWSRTNSSRH